MFVDWLWKPTQYEHVDLHALVAANEVGAKVAGCIDFENGSFAKMNGNWPCGMTNCQVNNRVGADTAASAQHFSFVVPFCLFGRRLS